MGDVSNQTIRTLGFPLNSNPQGIVILRHLLKIFAPGGVVLTPL